MIDVILFGMVVFFCGTWLGFRLARSLQYTLQKADRDRESKIRTGELRVVPKISPPPPIKKPEPSPIVAIVRPLMTPTPEPAESFFDGRKPKILYVHGFTPTGDRLAVTVISESNSTLAAAYERINGEFTLRPACREGQS